jgi:2-methylcitrate dehydratase PrpD
LKRHKIAPRTSRRHRRRIEGGKEFPGVDNAGPYSGTISAMMSHQFLVASTFVHGEISVRTVKMFDHPEVADLARRVFVEVDGEVDRAAAHKTGARLTVRLKSGGTIVDYQEEIDPLGMDEVVARFKTHAEGYMEKSRAEEIIDKTLNIESLKTVDELMNLLESDR